MELTATVWIEPVAIMQPWPEEENRLLVATRPFQLMVIGKLFYSYTYLNIDFFFLWLSFFWYSCGLLFSGHQQFLLY